MAVEKLVEFGDIEAVSPREAQVLVGEPRTAGLVGEAFAEFPVAHYHAGRFETGDLSADDFVAQRAAAEHDLDVVGAGEAAELAAHGLDVFNESHRAMGDGCLNEGIADDAGKSDRAWEEIDGGGGDGRSRSRIGDGSGIT